METAGKKLQLIGPLTKAEAAQKTQPVNDSNADPQISVTEKNSIYEVVQISIWKRCSAGLSGRISI